MPKIDPAILAVASLTSSSSTTTQSPHGGSGFSNTYRLVDGSTNKQFFVKTSNKKRANVMFEGEHASLNAICDAVEGLCPGSYGWGELELREGGFLVTDFLESGGGKGKGGGGVSLAEKLARLHTAPASTPDGYEKPQFGFPVTTCCGDTEQDNGYESEWAEFYGKRRLMRVLEAGEVKHGMDGALRTLVEEIVALVIPKLLGNGHLKDAKSGGNVRPVVVHGDLWSGNHGRGSINGGAIEEVIFDPSSSYSHNEFEFGIMAMFGGFSSKFETEYFEAKEKLGYGGKDEPVEEFTDRVGLYELYHHLNHYAIFGGGYKGGAVRVMERLIEKYGRTE